MIIIKTELKINETPESILGVFINNKYILLLKNNLEIADIKE